MREVRSPGPYYRPKQGQIVRATALARCAGIPQPGVGLIVELAAVFWIPRRPCQPDVEACAVRSVVTCGSEPEPFAVFAVVAGIEHCKQRLELVNCELTAAKGSLLGYKGARRAASKVFGASGTFSIVGAAGSGP